MMTVSELYKIKSDLTKEIYNTYDLLDVDLLKQKLMDVNCRIIKMLVKRG